MSLGKLIKVSDLSKRSGAPSGWIGPAFSARAGEVALLGENGVGKCTFF